MTLLRSEIPSGVCAKLRTVAVSNNRDHARNLSLRTLVIMFNRSHVNIGRAATSQSLLLLLARATYVYGAVLHAHPVRGESYNQRNTTGEVATTPLSEIKSYVASQSVFSTFPTRHAILGATAAIEIFPNAHQKKW